MRYLLMLVIVTFFSSCVSIQSTLKNVDNSAIRPSIKDKAYVITEYASDNKYGYDPDYHINIGFIHE